METKTFSLILIFLAVITLLGGTIIFQFQILRGLDAKMEAETHERELNASWNDGWDIGYAWGANNIFVEVIEKGFFTHNETWVLYSPEGCGAAFMAELESKGCEVECATSGAQ